MQLWSGSDARTAEVIAYRNIDGFSTRDPVPMPMSAGDVLFHNVRALPVHPRVRHCQADGAACLPPREPNHALRRDEAPFDYRPPPALDKGPLADGETPATFRYPANTRSLSARELTAPGTEPGRGRGRRGRLQLARPHSLAHHGSVAAPVFSRCLSRDGRYP